LKPSQVAEKAALVTQAIEEISVKNDRVYVIESKKGDLRLIRATSKWNAFNHVIQESFYPVVRMAKKSELIDYLVRGIPVENAVEEEEVITKTEEDEREAEFA
jgi:hypothetical protein